MGQGAGLHLVVPRSPAQHLSALEARRQTLGGEDGAVREERHVHALAKVHQDQAVVQVLRLKALVLQEPEADRAERRRGLR